MSNEKKLIASLTNIAGIGEATAKKLINDGVKKVSDLKKNKYFDSLSEETKFDLSYKICRNIPREVITSFYRRLPKRYCLQVFGSYKRGAQISHDIDLLTSSNLKEVSDAIANKFDVVGEYVSGDKKRAIVLKFPFDDHCYTLKVDIFWSSEEAMPFAQMHFTGSKNFNIRTRAHANRLGYTLNQYGLFNKKTGVSIKVKNEKEIFQTLGITWKTPEQRNE